MSICSINNHFSPNKNKISSLKSVSLNSKCIQKNYLIKKGYLVGIEKYQNNIDKINFARQNLN